MDKHTEIETIKATIEKLGKDSYLGPWLASVLANVEQEILSDIIPCIVPSDTRQRCGGIYREHMEMIKRSTDMHEATMQRDREQLEKERQRFEKHQDEFMNALRVCEHRIQEI